jgi:predicted SAM-dependent methyltransferase
MLSEAFRILKPGGIIRVTTPNIQLNWEAYKRGDVWFTHHFGNALPLDEGQNRQGHEMSVMLVNEIGSQLVQSVNGHKPRFTSHQEIDALINDKPLEEALQQS